MAESQFVSLDYREYPAEEMRRRAAVFYADVRRRRSVRRFSSQPVPAGVVEDCVRAAATAPSGANKQPYHFVVVTDPQVKRRIRAAAEAEEHAFYQRRASQEWLDDLAPLGTDAHKPFLEIAPCLIVIFMQRYSLLPDGATAKHYYVQESAGIAVGVLIAAIHHAGLVSLPYTPSRMGFLKKILGRPENERPFLLLAVGYPAEGATVPNICKKSLEEIATFV
ncbi:MAG: nitroreductase family protein [Anaerolineae bacterium]|nr:nitroreductase family protein [Anaerolineae bacterium]